MPPRAVEHQNAPGFICASSRAPIMPVVSAFSGQCSETKSLSQQIGKSTLRAPTSGHRLGADIGIEGQHRHREQPAAQFGDPRAGIADPDDADGPAVQIVAHISMRSTIRRSRKLVGLGDALGQRQHHAERMLGDGFPVASGLVDGDDACFGAGRHIDGVEARAACRHHQQIRALRQQLTPDPQMIGNVERAESIWIACDAASVSSQRRERSVLSIRISDRSGQASIAAVETRIDITADKGNLLALRSWDPARRIVCSRRSR